MTLASLYAQQGRWKDLDAVLADSQREVADDLGLGKAGLPKRLALLARCYTIL